MKTEMYCYHGDPPERTRLPSGVEGFPDAFDQWLDPSLSAVVSIDMHRSHVGPDAELTLPAPRARAKIDAHNRFHAHCRELGVPIVHALSGYRYGGIDDVRSRRPNRMANWRVIYEAFLPPNPLMDEHAWEGTKWTDLMIERGEEDLFVRTKKRLSAFYATDLEFLLRHLDTRNVVLTGTLTDACVMNTAFDAANMDFRVIVPRDIVAGSSEAAETSALSLIALHAGLVVDAEALLREWSARASTKRDMARAESRN